MKFRATISALGLLIGLGAESLAAPEKPLNIMQFMREQAASTRAGEARKTKPAAKTNAKPDARSDAARVPQQPADRAAAAKPHAGPPAPAILPEAATAFAAPMPSASPFPPPPPLPRPETVGAAAPTESKVQLVDAGELNDLDRKAGTAPSKLVSAPTSTSWLQAIWTAVGNLFAALTAAVHQLFRF